MKRGRGGWQFSYNLSRKQFLKNDQTAQNHDKNRPGRSTGKRVKRRKKKKRGSLLTKPVRQSHSLIRGCKREENWLARGEKKKEGGGGSSRILLKNRTLREEQTRVVVKRGREKTVPMGSALGRKSRKNRPMFSQKKKKKKKSGETLFAKKKFLGSEEKKLG